MKTYRFTALITSLNLAILIFSLFNRVRPVQASNSVPMLRANGLQIVDSQGKVRASIEIVPEGPARLADGSVQKDGKIYPETVQFRLIRPDGRPSVKITTSAQGSGLALGGGIDPTYVVFDVRGGDASLSLVNKEGKQQLIKP